jgi:hypothetical protein
MGGRFGEAGWPARSYHISATHLLEGGYDIRTVQEPWLDYLRGSRVTTPRAADHFVGQPGCEQQFARAAALHHVPWIHARAAHIHGAVFSRWQLSKPTASELGPC